MNRNSLFFMLFVAVLVINIVNANIVCHDQGNCSGDGSPGRDVRCHNCHSCTYKNCCHVRFTNVNNRCNISGWTSNEYKTRWNGNAPNGRNPKGRIPNGRIPNGRIPNGRIPNGRIPIGRIPIGRG